MTTLSSVMRLVGFWKHGLHYFVQFYRFKYVPAIVQIYRQMHEELLLDSDPLCLSSAVKSAFRASMGHGVDLYSRSLLKVN